MSDYLVHFTKTGENLAAILIEGFVRPGGPFGWGRTTEQVKDRHRSACFSEVPIDHVSRLAARHGHYGIGFHRSFVREAGGARVWYVDDSSPVAKALFEHVGTLISRGDFTAALWQLTPFIDRVIPGRYQFEWEREWRVPGGLSFTMEDVAFVITPEGNEMHLEQEPGLDVPFVSPDGETWWPALPALLGDSVEAMVAKFLQEFENPVGSLPVDGGHYEWIVPKWETEDALAEIFGVLEPKVYQRLADHLNNISPSWVRVSDFYGWWDH